MLRIRLTQSAKGFADVSIEATGPGQVATTELARKISEKWLFDFSREFDKLFRQHRHLANESKSLKSGIELKLAKKSAALTRLLIGEDIYLKQIFTATPNVPVVFIVDAVYCELPFEALHDGTNFLCDLRPVFRVLRTSTTVRPKSASLRPWKKEKLYLPVAAGNLADVRGSALKERQQIAATVLQRKSALTPLSGEIPEPSLNNFIENLLEVENVHFAGHATPHEIALANGAKLHPAEIETLDLKHIHSIFLNACEGAKLNKLARGQKTFAEAFIAAGVENFIGFATVVPNAFSESFASDFWRARANGLKTHAALFEARQKIRKDARLAVFRFLPQQFGHLEISRGINLVPIYAAAVGAFALAALFWAWWPKATIAGSQVITTATLPQARPDTVPTESKATLEQKREIKRLFPKFAVIPYKYGNDPKDSYTGEETLLMNRLFDLIAATADKNNFVCRENLRNGKLPRNSEPVHRIQILRNLFVFHCVVGGPEDWDGYAATKRTLK